MKKAAKVNYPKKRSRLRLEDFGDTSEPERTSMYQMLLTNLKGANRATFVHRIIYVGEHSFAAVDDVRNVFQDIIQRANETYCVEKLTGFLLVYNRYLVHMVEGDEDNLNKHIKYLLDTDAEHYRYLGTMKLLIHISNINQRFFEEWISYSSAPSKLLEKLDVSGADLQQSGRHVYNCIKKIYALMGHYAEERYARPSSCPPKGFMLERENSNDSYNHSTTAFDSYSITSCAESIIDQSGDTTTKEYKLLLPEYELIEFVIKTSFTPTLREYHEVYGVVPMRDINKDKVWPVPHDFIPYDIFEEPYDCPTELGRDLKKRIEEGRSVSVAPSVDVLFPKQSVVSEMDIPEPSGSEMKNDSTINE